MAPHFQMSKDKIYQAQCFGNVEPIEYMVPYPNLRSLAVGQCIKFANNLLFKDHDLTNKAFLNLIDLYSIWLESKNVKKGDMVFVNNIPSPYLDILCYAIWSIGGILVISDEKNAKIDAKLKIKDESIIDQISTLSLTEGYTPKSNVLLNDAAVLFYHKDTAILLSHYNLLINAYGILKELKILYNQSINVDIPVNSTTYLVLNTVLPLYAGASIANNADIVFGDQTESDYKIEFDWNELVDRQPQSLYVLPEATAILAIGNKPNHLLSINKNNEQYKINGHSVMMGYTSEEQNSQVFKEGSLVISK